MKILKPILLPVRIGNAQHLINDANDKRVLTIDKRYDMHMEEAQAQVINALNTHKELVTALRDAVKLLAAWHDEGTEDVAYRFDLTDHPKVAPMFAALAKATGEGS